VCFKNWKVKTINKSQPKWLIKVSSNVYSKDFIISLFINTYFLNFLGDSGGPLVIKERGRFVLVGITSAGFGCGVDHQPGGIRNLSKIYN